MPTSIEAQGVTVEEAIQVALNQLGVTRDRVEIEIIHHPRSGFLGLGARRARVRATVREAFLADGEEYDMSTGTVVGRGGRRSRRSRRRRGRKGETRPEVEQPARRGGQRDGRSRDDSRGREEARGREEGRGRDEARGREEGRGRDEARGREEGKGRDEARGREEGKGRDEARGREEGRGRDEARGREESRGRDERRARDDRGGAQGDRGRRSRDRRGRESGRPYEQHGRGPAGGADRRAEPARRPEPNAVVEARVPTGVEPEPADSAGREREVFESSRTLGLRDLEPAPQGEQVAPQRVLPADELARRAEAAVKEILKRMGFEATVASSLDDAEGEVVIKVDADAEGLLIGRRGQTLDALEHLVNRMVMSGESTAEARIAIDVGGYRQRRRDTLIELADRLKERALAQGRRIQVSPMSPRDRRILQSVLGHDENVRTRVLGTGFYRRVLIFPVGIDEENAPLEAETEDEEGAEAQAGVDEDEGA